MTELTHAQSVGLSWHGPRLGLIGVQFAQSLLHPEEELEEEEEAGGVQSSIGGGVSQDVHSLLGEHYPYGIHSEQSKLHPELEEELDELDDELLAGQAV